MKLLPNTIESDTYLGKGTEYLGIAILLILLIFGLSIFAVANRSIDLGDIGSFLSGSIGSIIALLAAFFTFLAFYVQYDANKKIQQQFRIQQFESLFNKMLDIHISNLESFRIRNYVVKPKELSVTRGETRGRRIFLPLVKEYHYALEIVHSFYYNSSERDKVSLNRIAYDIFFYGITSNHLKGLTSHDNQLKLLKKRLIEFQNTYRSSESKQRTFSLPKAIDNRTKNIEIKLRYVPFDGHESRLAHYYRHLYQTVRLVEDAQKREVISYVESRRYLAILRAQLSNQEQLLLYYTYVSGAGYGWDKLGGKHQFLSKYRMIHNLPLDDNRIHKKIEHPRDHFKAEIQSIATKDDPLFEWGDY